LSTTLLSLTTNLMTQSKIKFCFIDRSEEENKKTVDSLVGLDGASKAQPPLILLINRSRTVQVSF